MTKEEAIYKAKHLRKVHPNICIDAEDFWETVIAALEQEPCEDCVSRQAAIDLADELKDDLPDDDRLSDMVMSHNEGILEYQTKLSLLPSVQPECTEAYCPAAFKPVECEDCVSREEVIKKAIYGYSINIEMSRGIEQYKTQITDMLQSVHEAQKKLIENLPPVTPQPKMGRWIPTGYDGYADGNPVYDWWECSECGWEHTGEEDTLTPYCPNCGAKMQEVEE